LAQQGDFEGALLKLDEAARLLAADPARKHQLAEAYLYLGTSYLELNQELNARAKFVEVLRLEPQRRLSERIYSAQVIRVFEAARVELYPPVKKKRNFLPILLVAGGGTAAAGVAGAASSGGGEERAAADAAAPTTTLATGGGGGGTTTTTTLGSDPGTPTTTTTTTTSTT